MTWRRTDIDAKVGVVIKLGRDTRVHTTVSLRGAVELLVTTLTVGVMMTTAFAYPFLGEWPIAGLVGFLALVYGCIFGAVFSETIYVSKCMLIENKRSKLSKDAQCYMPTVRTQQTKAWRWVFAVGVILSVFSGYTALTDILYGPSLETSMNVIWGFLGLPLLFTAISYLLVERWLAKC